MYVYQKKAQDDGPYSQDYKHQWDHDELVVNVVHGLPEY